MRAWRAAEHPAERVDGGLRRDAGGDEPAAVAVALVGEHRDGLQDLRLGDPAGAAVDDEVVRDEGLDRLADPRLPRRPLDAAVDAPCEVLPAVARDREAGGEVELVGAAGEETVDEAVDGLDLE